MIKSLPASRQANDKINSNSKFFCRDSFYLTAVRQVAVLSGQGQALSLHELYKDVCIFIYNFLVYKKGHKIKDMRPGSRRL